MFRHPRAVATALGLCAWAAVQAQANPSGTLPTVVISAGPGAESSRKEVQAEIAVTPGGVAAVEGEGLRLRNITSTADMLRYTPGVWAASGFTGASSFLSIRGSSLDATNCDGNGVKLLQDGLPVTAADGSHHNRDTDPLTARRIIVARGANALTCGASTLGGAIDFISPTARDGEPWEVLVNGGSQGQRQGRLTVGTLNGKFDALVSGEAKRSVGFRQHQLDAYSLGGLRAGYTRRQWEICGELRNAGDRKYVSYVSARDVAETNAVILNPGEPRSLYVGARLKC